MTFHRRKDWTTAPAANARRFPKLGARGIAIHWNGPAVPKSALKDPRNYLEGVRRYHVFSNRWSDFAYNLAVDQNGDIWQGRGLGWQSAANGNTYLNGRYVAILAILGEGQEPSPAMIRGLRKAILRSRLRHPLARKTVGHGDIRPGGTECPGPDLRRRIHAGNLKPWRKPKPKPVCTKSCPVHCPKES